ncbi:54S ribosomal protein L3 [Escovopsis weberi]|uniref:Large ribosomal subunit protein mL44 n=1 Tax=Escovopsis weberi TaxID=150374 RepID=A0A0M8N627_ESCWE|nr:54S ribosomal protein L3 [Escovopsis weberi]
MKRLRTAACWSGQLSAAARQRLLSTTLPRCQTSSAAFSSSASSSAAASSSTAAAAAAYPTHEQPPAPSRHQRQPPPPPPPSPAPEQAARSAKLAALHARLALPKKIPLEALARALVTPSADPAPNFNNANLAFLGSTIINYHVLEHLVCKWPRLPTVILYETLRAYAGTDSLQQIARRWGVEAAAAPGPEVDPGLLQWSAAGDGQQHALRTRWGYVRAEAAKGPAWRRGLSSRVVLDDAFGDPLQPPPSAASTTEELDFEQLQSEAFESLVQAVVGAIYAHCGREEAKAFVASHILSRQFDPSVLFHFQLPTRELAMLCAREGFEPPLARLETETGRLSRTPVYVVGIYSGEDKLGEGAGPSLDVARRKASMASLKAWYLYSPGNKVRVPSDTMEKSARTWKAPHIDPGEII